MKEMDSYPDERKGERMVYCILRILNNNALLAEEKGDGSERILLGKGIGFGKRAGDEVTIDEGVQAVSYTHLDVYKRQVRTLVICIMS